MRLTVLTGSNIAEDVRGVENYNIIGWSEVHKNERVQEALVDDVFWVLGKENSIEAQPRSNANTCKDCRNVGDTVAEIRSLFDMQKAFQEENF